MNIDEQFKSRINATFGPLRTVPGTFPPSATLAKALRNESSRTAAGSKYITPQLASNFGKAAVEIWQRSVHSFLISTSLTSASPIWASVSGYYSSHYSVRGIAHLLGFFYLFTRKFLVRLEPGPRGGYTCSFTRAQGSEHQLYWKRVKESPSFSADPLFTENLPDTDESDSAHRNFANYLDHISLYPVFNPLDRESIQMRVDQISKMVFDDAPIPRLSKFPDVAYVQLIAYHRIVSFRRILDEVLGHDNRFWNVHRNPSFASEYLDFQLTEGSKLTQLN